MPLSSPTSRWGPRVTEASAPVIRPVSEGDRPIWEKLFVAYGVFYETTFTPQIIDGVWSWLMDPRHPVDGLVAELDGRVVGFAHLREYPDTFEAASSWFLDDLFTAPDARGQGVARALIEALDEHVATHGGGVVRWITAATNAPAQALYDQLATRTSWVMYEQEIPG